MEIEHASQTSIYSQSSSKRGAFCFRSPSLAIRFPRLLRGLVDAVICGDTLRRRSPATSGGHRGASGDRGGADSDGGSTLDGACGGGLASGDATAGAEDRRPVDPWRGGSWEDLAAPAARLWAACRPSESAQLEAIDEVLGDIIRQQDGSMVGRLLW